MQQAKQAIRAAVSKLTLRRLLIATVLYWGPIAVLAVLADEVPENDTLHLDAQVLQFIHGISSPWLDTLMIQLTDLGGFGVVSLALAGGVAYLVTKRRWRDSILLLAGVGGAMALNLVLKAHFQRARPEFWQHLVTETSFSFPSGHATMSMALAACAVLLLWRTRWRLLALVLGSIYVLVVGLTRMYLGVHFPTDILAGWCASLLWVLIVQAILAGHWFGFGPSQPQRQKS